MKFAIYRKNSPLDDEKESFLEEKDIPRNKYNAIILLIRVLVACIFAFGLGYFLSPTVESFLDDFIIVGIKFICILIFMYLSIGYLFTLISTMLLPKAFTKDNIKIYLRLFSAKVRSDQYIKEGRIIFSLLVPFFLLSVIPIIYFILDHTINGFNLYLYAFISASTIKSVSYLFYVIAYARKYADDINVEIYDYIN